MNERSELSKEILNLRRYIGALVDWKDPLLNKQPGDKLTIREYVQVTPLLTIDEITHLVQQAYRGIKRFWNRV